METKLKLCEVCEVPCMTVPIVVMKESKKSYKVMHELCEVHREERQKRTDELCAKAPGPA